MSPTTSAADIHGHDVLFLVHHAAETRPFTPDSLRTHVTAVYGADARYCTCHGGGMTFDDLLAFLLARGKIVQRDGFLFTDMSQVCGGGDHHDHHH